VNYTYKVIAAIALTPLIYVAHAVIDRYLGAGVAATLKEQATADRADF
jgi:hypothetical protein